ncbi:MAG: hypothetical protein ACO1SV_12350 [Fimbriimonas sp.]
MTSTHLLMATAILTPVITAAEADYNAFKRARAKDPKATFDTGLFAVRVMKGLVAGCAAAAGASAIVG